MIPTSIRQLLRDAEPGRPVALGGWVRTARHSKGGFSFLSVHDGSCLSGIQVVAGGELPNYADDVLHLTTGCSVWVEGKLVESKGKGQQFEVQASHVALLGKADPESYPIQPKHHTLEFLRTQAHLRPRTSTFAAVARIRNAMSAAIHAFFQSHGYLYVHTPIVTASDCEGAGQLFRVSTLDLTNPPRTDGGAIDFSQDFFGRSSYLTVSGQLEAETYACALSKVYTFGPTFRAENSNTPRHLAEFWMVEPETAFCDLSDDADLAESFLKHVFRTVLDGSADDLKFLHELPDARDGAATKLRDTLEQIVTSQFVRLDYTDAVELLIKSGRNWTFPVHWGSDLQTEHERYLTEEQFGRPVIVMNYPASIKAFYMRMNGPEKAGPNGEPTVAAMDVLVPGIGEIIGGSQREERLDVLTERMKATGMPAESYWWYLDLRRYGTVPHAGFGLGLERTIQFVTGMANIRDVIPFPRTPRSADF